MVQPGEIRCERKRRLLFCKGVLLAVMVELECMCPRAATHVTAALLEMQALIGLPEPPKRQGRRKD